ncbi:MAG: TolC family protein, partial [Gemmatimonadota bacterium]
MRLAWCMIVLATVQLSWAPSAAGQERAAPSVLDADSIREVTLEEALGIARTLNPELRVSGTGVEQAEYNRLDAFGNFLPDFNAGFGYSNSSTGRLDQTGQAITTTSYFFQLTGRYNLFEGFRKFTELKSARLDLSAEQARYRQDE